MIIGGDNQVLLAHGELKNAEALFGDISILKYERADDRIIVNDKYNLPAGVFRFILNGTVTSTKMLEKFKIVPPAVEQDNIAAPTKSHREEELLKRLIDSYCASKSYYEMYRLYKDMLITREEFVNAMVKMLNEAPAIGPLAVEVKKMVYDGLWQEIYDDLLFNKQYTLLMHDAELFHDGFSLEECADILTEQGNHRNCGLNQHIVANIDALSTETIVKMLRIMGCDCRTEYAGEICKRNVYPDSIKIYRLMQGWTYVSGITEEYLGNYKKVMKIKN
jgi:hypothetical protein